MRPVLGGLEVLRKVCVTSHHRGKEKIASIVVIVVVLSKLRSGTYARTQSYMYGIMSMYVCTTPPAMSTHAVRNAIWCYGWYGRYVGMQYATIQRREMRDEMGSARRAATTMSEYMYA